MSVNIRRKCHFVTQSSQRRVRQRVNSTVPRAPPGSVLVPVINPTHLSQQQSHEYSIVLVMASCGTCTACASDAQTDSKLLAQPTAPTSQSSHPPGGPSSGSAGTKNAFVVILSGLRTLWWYHSSKCQADRVQGYSAPDRRGLRKPCDP